MNKLLTSILTQFFLTVCFSACDNNQIKDLIVSETGELAATIETDDAEIEITEQDKKCLVDEDCVIIDQGCCRGEKPIAVHRDRAPSLINKRKIGCRKIINEHWKKMREEKQERKTILDEARNVKGKKEKLEILKKLKHQDTKRDLCFGRADKGLGNKDEAKCINCQCEIQIPGFKASVGPNCIKANEYLIKNREAMLKGLEKVESNFDKKSGIELWNKLINLAKNSQECACETYLKELEDTMNRLGIVTNSIESPVEETKEQEAKPEEDKKDD